MNDDTANVIKAHLDVMYIKKENSSLSPVALQRSDFQHWVPKMDFSHF